MVYVNKMDTMGADFFNCIKMMHDRLHANGVAIQLPIGSEDTFKGIIDLVDMTAEVYYDEMGNDMRIEAIPDDMKEQAEEYRNILVEAVAENDETLMEKYLEGEEITREELKAAIRKETIANHRQHPGSRCLRFFLQEQGHSEAAGCHRGLHARPHRHRGCQGRES